MNEYEQLRPASLPPGGPAVALPDPGDLDEEWAEYVAWLDRESAAGQIGRAHV